MTAIGFLLGFVMGVAVRHGLGLGCADAGGPLLGLREPDRLVALGLSRCGLA